MFRYLILLSLLLASANASAQIKAKTPMGIEVILYEDGTWSADTKEKKQTTTTTPNQAQTKFDTCKFWNEIEPTEDTGLSLVITFEKINKGEVSLLSIKPKDTRALLDTSKPFTFSFDDGTSLPLGNDSSYNDTFYSIYFGKGYRDNNEMESFKTSKISSIMYYQDGNKVVKDITDTQAEVFFRGFNCR